MKRFLSLALSVIFTLSLAACSADDSKPQVNSGSGETNVSGIKADPVGGWTESDITPADAHLASRAPYLLSDGTLWYFTQEVENGSPVEEKSIVKYVSSDNGTTWTGEPVNWLQTTGGEIPLGFDVYKDGTVLFQTFYGKAAHRRLWLCKKDGTPEELVFEDFADDISQMIFLSENTIFLLSSGNMDKNGNIIPPRGAIFDINSKQKLSDVNFDNLTSGMLFAPASFDGKLYFAGYNSQGDVTLNEVLPDGTINEGIAELTDFNYGSASMDADGNYYFLSKQGISRIAKGGSITEVIVEGSTFAITSPENYTSGVCVTADGSIIASVMPNSNSNEEADKITKSTLYKYSYDENLTVSENNPLRVWSLHENLIMRGAIVKFSKVMPQIPVSIEIAISDGDILPQDALQKLNTELLSGQGPDIIIFDGSDYTSYIKQGMLENLAPVLKDIPFQENLTAPFYQNNAAYVLPARFSVPVLAGNPDELNSVSSLADLKKVILSMPNRTDLNANDEEYYTPLDNNSQYALSFKSIKELTDFVLQTSMPAIINDNKINSEALNEAYEFIKEISDYYGLASYREEQTDNAAVTGNEAGSAMMTDGTIEFVQTSRAHYGREIMPTLALFSVAHDMAADKDNFTMIPQPGLVSGAYLPQSLVGVNANSTQKDAALEFVKTIFSSEVQSTFYGYDGSVADGVSVLAPVLKNSIKNNLTDKQDAKFKANAQSFFSSLKTPVMINSVEHDKILAHSTALCKGEETIEKAISETIKDLELYLAERR